MSKQPANANIPPHIQASMQALNISDLAAFLRLMDDAKKRQDEEEQKSAFYRSHPSVRQQAFISEMGFNVDADGMPRELTDVDCKTWNTFMTTCLLGRTLAHVDKSECDPFYGEEIQRHDIYFGSAQGLADLIPQDNETKSAWIKVFNVSRPPTADDIQTLRANKVYGGDLGKLWWFNSPRN